MFSVVWSIFAILFSIIRWVLSLLIPGFDEKLVAAIADDSDFEEEAQPELPSKIHVAHNSHFFSLVVPEWLFEKNAKDRPDESMIRGDSKHKHYWSCERKHTWSWKADERLSVFWQSLSAVEQDEIRVVREEELLREIEKATCVISKQNRVALAKLYVVDVHFLQVFGDIFWRAVETNRRILVSRFLMEAIRRNVDRILEKKGSKLSSFQIAAKEHCRLLFVTKFLKVLERNLVRAFRRRDLHHITAAPTGSGSGSGSGSGGNGKKGSGRLENGGGGGSPNAAGAAAAAAAAARAACGCLCHSSATAVAAPSAATTGGGASSASASSAGNSGSMVAECTQCTCAAASCGGDAAAAGGDAAAAAAAAAAASAESEAEERRRALARQKRKEKRERKKAQEAKQREARRAAKEVERERRKEAARAARQQQQEARREEEAKKEALKSILGKLESKLSDAQAIYGVRKPTGRGGSGGSSGAPLVLRASALTLSSSAAFHGPTLLDSLGGDGYGDGGSGGELSEGEEDAELAALREEMERAKAAARAAKQAKAARAAAGPASAAGVSAAAALAVSASAAAAAANAGAGGGAAAGAE